MNYNVQVVGDFEADEAWLWFDMLIEGTVSNEDWERVSAVSRNVWVVAAVQHCDLVP